MTREKVIAFSVPEKVKEKVCWASIYLGVRFGCEQDAAVHFERWGSVATGWERAVPGPWLMANVNHSGGQAARPTAGCLQVFRGPGGPEPSGDSAGQWAAIHSECGRGWWQGRFWVRCQVQGFLPIPVRDGKPLKAFDFEHFFRSRMEGLTV